MRLQSSSREQSLTDLLGAMTLFLLIEEYDDLKETVKKGLLKRFWLYNSLLGPDYFLLAAVGRSDYLE